MKCNFDELYPKLIAPLQEIEKKRIALLKKKVLLTVLFSTLLAAAIHVYSGINGGLSIFDFDGVIISIEIGISFLIVGVYFFTVQCSKRVKLSAEYKTNVVTQMIANILPCAEFHQDRGITCDFFVNSILSSREPDRYNSEDLVTGSVGETEFLFSEIHAEARHYDSKGNTKWTDIFKGFFFIADFHKDFNGTTFVRRDRLIKFSTSKKMDRVKLENPAFEKIFDVYGTDQVEARYLLTPSIMERLVALNNKVSSKITLAFQNSEVHIAIPQKRDNFEVSLLSTILSKGKIEREFALLITLIEIVDDLNLNTRIWSKE